MAQRSTYLPLTAAGLIIFLIAGLTSRLYHGRPAPSELSATLVYPPAWFQWVQPPQPSPPVCSEADLPPEELAKLQWRWSMIYAKELQTQVTAQTAQATKQVREEAQTAQHPVIPELRKPAEESKPHSYHHFQHLRRYYYYKHRHRYWHYR